MLCLRASTEAQHPTRHRSRCCFPIACLVPARKHLGDVALGIEQAPAKELRSPPDWTRLRSTRGAAGETPASPGDPVEQLALVALELDFCVLERASTRAALNETAEMDESQQRS